MSEEIKKAAQQPEQAAAPAEQAAEAKPEAAPEKDKKEKGSKNFCTNKKCRLQYNIFKKNRD